METEVNNAHLQVSVNHLRLCSNLTEVRLQFEAGVGGRGQVCGGAAC